MGGYEMQGWFRRAMLFVYRWVWDEGSTTWIVKVSIERKSDQQRQLKNESDLGLKAEIEELVHKTGHLGAVEDHAVRSERLR